MKPCNICKGSFPRPCMICGCKKEKTKKKSLTNTEIVIRDARRDEIMTLNQYSHNSLRCGNCSTKDSTMDVRIADHRRFARAIWHEYDTLKKSLGFLTEKYDLTESQIKKILATTLMQLRSGFPDMPKFREEERKVEKPNKLEEYRKRRCTGEPTFKKVVDLIELLDEFQNYCELARVEQDELSLENFLVGLKLEDLKGDLLEYL